MGAESAAVLRAELARNRTAAYLPSPRTRTSNSSPRPIPGPGPQTCPLGSFPRPHVILATAHIRTQGGASVPPAPGLGQVGRAGAVTRSPRVPVSDAGQRATPGPTLTVGCRAPAWTSTCWAEPAVPAALLLPGSQRPSRPPPHGRSVQRPAPPSSAAPRLSVRKRSPHACAAEHVGRAAQPHLHRQALKLRFS